MTDTYLDWVISFDYGWSAYHPDFDASWQGEETGYVSNGLCITGCQSRAALIAEIDALMEEHPHFSPLPSVGGSNHD